MSAPARVSDKLARMAPGRRALIIAIGYALLGVLWIVVSDQVVIEWTDDAGVASLLQRAKGLLYVLGTAAALFVLARSLFRALDSVVGQRDRRLADVESLLGALPHLCFRARGDGVILERLQTQGPSPYLDDEAFLGRRVHDTLPHPVGRQIGELVELAVRDGAPQSIAYSLGEGVHKHYFEADIRPIAGTGEVFALVRDVTDRHEDAAQLELASQVFEQSRHPILLSAADGAILAVNPAFERVTGYKAGEVVGHDPRLLRSGRHDDAYFAEMWRSLRERGSWEGEIWNRRKSGEIFPEHLSIRSVPQTPGQRVRYIGIFQDLTDQKAAAEAIDRLSHEDPVTGLPNRRVAVAMLEHAVETAHRTGSQGAVLSIDLDDFSRLNEAHGFGVGDVVLREVAVRIVALCEPDDLIARIGADEFLVVHERLRDPEEAARLGSRIDEALRQGVDLGEVRVQPSVSIGIALVGVDGRSAEELLRNAETARRAAHRLSSRGPAFYRAELTETTRRELELDAELSRAIENDELVLHYQSICGSDGVPLGAEALVRWERPDGTLVPPDAFIPRAEITGQIAALGVWVLRRACRDAVALREAGLPFHRLAVNVSPRQLAEEDLVAIVEQVLHETGLPASVLELELTESALMQDVDAAAAMLERLAALGVRIAIDDFGTGYSSLATLRRFAVHKLKIDRAFVRGLPDDPANRAICSAVIELARAFHLVVHAEGVETREQLDALGVLGCDRFQGYFFGRPLPLATFRAQLEQPA